jgi:peptidoglycan/xylan/chitin deacetylase (PgdA/CDA1 family)
MLSAATLAVLACSLCAPALSSQAPARRVAITIDDLPRGRDGGPRSFAEIRQMTDRLLAPLRAEGIPATGFVIAGRREGLTDDQFRQLLDVWLDAGAGLGSHSYSHLNLHEVPFEEYTADILKAEPVLRAALGAKGRSLVYYRHPYLFTGHTPEIKQALQDFLANHGYRVAPVTIDNADYMWAALYTRPEHRDRVKQEYLAYMESVVTFFEERGVEVVGREFPHVLLLHANELNADMMPALVEMFRRRGYAFVTLDEALADPAYLLPDETASRGGFSWIHRWSLTKNMPPRAEPEPPEWVTKAWEAIGR